MNFTGYLIITALYGLSVWLLHKKGRKPLHSSNEDIGNVIATPNKVMVHLIDDEKDINYSEFADFTFKLSDLLKGNTVITKPEVSKPSLIKYEEIDFLSFVSIIK